MSKTFLHSGARGDIIYALPTIKALGGGTLYIKIDPSHYKIKPMDLKDLEWFRELLDGQEYIEGVKEWTPDCHIDYDLDTFREIIKPCQQLSSAHLERFGVSFDLSQPWLNVAKLSTREVPDIVISRSERYHGAFAWGELSNWQDKCLFVGMQGEYTKFIAATGLKDVQYYGECTYRRLAELIAGSKLFIGNQSFPYALAEAMKHPRVLEVCTVCPNCLPQSDNGFTYLSQSVLRHFLLGEPYKAEPSMNYCKLIIWMKVRSGSSIVRPNITYIVVHGGPEVPSSMAKAITRDKFEVLWDDGEEDYRKTVNLLASRAQGRTICVVDMSLIEDYQTIRRVAELLTNGEGIGGLYLKDSLALSNSCFAVSRKAFEECGLFNLAMLPGSHNLVEMVLRYARKRYPCRSAGVTLSCDHPDLPLYAEKNEAYIKRIYGGKV